jgi:hypothetical protein
MDCVAASFAPRGPAGCRRRDHDGSGFGRAALDENHLKMPEIACGEHDLPIRHPIYTGGRDWPDETEPTFTLGSRNTPRTAGKTGKWCGFGRKAT